MLHKCIDMLLTSKRKYCVVVRMYPPPPERVLVPEPLTAAFNA
jgi:hypothetical protein